MACRAQITTSAEDTHPVTAPCRALDFELEMVSFWSCPYLTSASCEQLALKVQRCDSFKLSTEDMEASLYQCCT